VPFLATGHIALDPRLGDVASAPEAAAPGLFAEETLAEAEAVLDGGEVLLAVQGPRGVGKRLLLMDAAARLGRRVLLINAGRLMARPPDAVRPLVHSLLREARLLDAVPVIPDLDSAQAAGTDRF